MLTRLPLAEFMASSWSLRWNGLGATFWMIPAVAATPYVKSHGQKQHQTDFKNIVWSVHSMSVIYIYVCVQLLSPWPQKALPFREVMGNGKKKKKQPTPFSISRRKSQRSRCRNMYYLIKMSVISIHDACALNPNEPS